MRPGVSLVFMNEKHFGLKAMNRSRMLQWQLRHARYCPPVRVSCFQTLRPSVWDTMGIHNLISEYAGLAEGTRHAALPPAALILAEKLAQGDIFTVRPYTHNHFEHTPAEQLRKKSLGSHLLYIIKSLRMRLPLFSSGWK